MSKVPPDDPFFPLRCYRSSHGNLWVEVDPIYARHLPGYAWGPVQIDGVLLPDGLPACFWSVGDAVAYLAGPPNPRW